MTLKEIIDKDRTARATYKATTRQVDERVYGYVQPMPDMEYSQLGLAAPLTAAEVEKCSPDFSPVLPKLDYPAVMQEFMEEFMEEAICRPFKLPVDGKNFLNLFKDNYDLRSANEELNADIVRRYLSGQLTASQG